MEEKLLKLLYEDQEITEAQYQRVIAEIERTGQDCAAVLQQFEILSEDAIVHYLSQKFRMPVASWKDAALDPELFELVPAALALKHRVFPCAIERGKRRGRILLAIADPSNVAVIDEVAFRTGCAVKAVVASPRAIREAIRQHYGVDAIDGPQPGTARIEQADGGASLRFAATHIDAFDAILGPLLQSPDMPDDDDDVLTALDHDHPSSKLLLELLELAVVRGCAEIHLDPGDQEYRVRLRLRGMLHPHSVIPDQVGRGVAVRLRRLLQRADNGGPKREQPHWSGSFHTTRIGPSPLTVVVNLYPSIFGENILLKLTPLASLRDVDQLGITDDGLKRLHRLLAKAEGLLLILGPPDHGVTTTLYALLNYYQQAAMQTVLIESPPACLLPGVTQISGHTPLSSQAWRSFAAYTDPDVLAVSDLEDDDLFKFVFAASSGTRVLASCPASHALSGFRSLAEAMQSALNLSLPALLPVLVDSLNGIIVQRLIRTLCPHCKAVIPPAAQEAEPLRELGLEAGVTPLYRPTGCPECQDTGYHGQTGVFEILRCEKHLTQALLQHPPIALAAWNQVLADLSIPTLQGQIADLVRQGLSSPQEARHALSA
jgi:type IV pilus assembly protein PilB